MNASAQVGSPLRALLGTLGGVIALASVAILFAALKATFIFSGPFLPHIDTTLRIYLFAAAVLLCVTGLLSRFDCLYTGFQDEAVVILAATLSSLVAVGAAPVGTDLYVTALVVVATSTALTAVFFLLMGSLRLGRMIRYVPFSVSAGFMITVGGLLIIGGIELAESRKLLEVARQFAHGVVPWKALLALAVTLLVLLAARIGGGVLSLPLTLALVCGAFHLVARLAEVTPADLVADGWVLPSLVAERAPAGFDALRAAHIDWALVAGQWHAYVSIAVISALALLLAVTSLELSTRQRVNVDRELRAAGAANVLTALAGGAPGYHDDSVTAILHRQMRGHRGTVVGAALLCALAAFLDTHWFSWVPLPVLGGVLVWLGWQLWRDWLFHHAGYLHRTDWIAVVAIVCVTLAMGFIAGVMLGVGVGIALFLVDYSQVRTVRYLLNGREIRSNIDRSPQAEQRLYELGRRIHVVKLQGYLFFARSHQVILQLEPVFEGLRHEEPHYLLIDFHGVAGIDSTATMAFLRLKQMAADVGASLVFTGLSMEARVDLARIELADGSVLYFQTLDQGLAHCEDELLGDSETITSGLVGTAEIFGRIVELSARGAHAESYLSELQVKAGETLIGAGSAADGIYVVRSGSLTVKIAGASAETIALRGMEPGSVFGEMAFYLGGKRSATVTADTDAVVLRLGNEALERMERDDPPLAMEVHKLMARLLATKLRQTNTWLSHLR